MISKDTAVLIGAGALSGLMYASPAMGHTFSLIFAFFAPLPLFASGLAFGPASAIVAIVAGIVSSAVVGGPFDIPFGAPGYIVVVGVPGALLVRQALLSRQQDGAAMWYPPGHLLTWLVGLAAVYFLVAALALSATPGGLVGALEAWLGSWMEGVQETELAADAVEMIAFMAGRLPAAAAIVWVFCICVNMALAQAILVRRARNRRPSPVFSTLEIPFVVMFPFVATLALAFLPGTLGFIGVTLAVIISIPYFLVGLAVLHTASRSWPMREIILGGVYILTIVVFWFLVGLTTLGFAEHWLRLRRRFAGHT